MAEKLVKAKVRIMTEQVVIRLPVDLIRAVDEFRRMEPDIPVRSEAIRRLLDKALGRIAPKTLKRGRQE